MVWQLRETPERYREYVPERYEAYLQGNGAKRDVGGPCDTTGVYFVSHLSPSYLQGSFP